MPAVAALVITPVSALYPLTHRPLRSHNLVPKLNRLREAYLSIDGQLGMPLFDGDRIRCRKSEHRVRLLSRTQRSL